MRNIILTGLFALILSVGKAQFTTLFDFTNVEYPQGSLISDGTFLYGMTKNGGLPSHEGIIFKIEMDGSGFTKILDFDYTNTGIGSNPTGSLISDGTFLYGMVFTSIFKVKTDGTGLTSLMNFTTATGHPNGSSLIYDGTFLYGMTQNGGTATHGIIFKIKPDGSGYKKLYEFSGSTDGNGPVADLFFDGTYLFGMTQYGGLNNKGIIFKIKPDGTGYTKIFDFTASTACAPTGSLISDGTYLYGLGPSGGAHTEGSLFKIKPDGTGYMSVLDFADTISGKNPYGSPIFDGTFLYGMTRNGGGGPCFGIKASYGTIFKIKPDGSGFSKMHSFCGTKIDGARPYGSLITDGSYLYGMTAEGGVNYYGDVFKFQYKPNGIETYSSTTQGAISIYPNPNNGTFRLSCTNLKENTANFVIYNTIGQIVKQGSIVNPHETIIDINNVPHGIYSVQIISNTQIAQQKIIKQ